MALRLLHWGPFIALSIIFGLSSCTVYSMFVLWRPGAPTISYNLIPFFLNFFLVMYNFLMACFCGPGGVPAGWRPDKRTDEANLQYCDPCGSYKAPRAHHCSKCKRCSLKMDHHCPWINNCVGHANQSAFIRFLLHVPIGCVHASVVMSLCVYRAIFVKEFVHNTFLPYTPLILLATLLAIGLAIGVTVGVGFLLAVQLRNVCHNATEIEQWIVRKAHGARKSTGEKFVHPYDVGCWPNLLFTMRDEGDGITWPVRDGCDQYTLTREQLAQKRRKREMTVPYAVTRDFRRDYCGACFGCATIVTCPSPDEPRLTIQKGDLVMVTRTSKRWLYGNKVLAEYVEKLQWGLDSIRPNQYSHERGWFPRPCADPLKKGD